MSSPCPAIPTTSVENSSGAIIDLIIRRNTFDSTLRSVAAQPRWSARAASGYMPPTMMPITIATMIHCEREIRRRKLLGAPAEVSAVVAELVYIKTLLEHDRARSPAQGGITIPVREVQDEADHEPPAKAHPRQRGQPLHDEYAKGRPDQANAIDERHT